MDFSWGSPRGKFLDSNSRVFCSGILSAVTFFINFRLKPEVQTFFLLAALNLMSAALANDGSSLTTDWADESYFISHTLEPAELITHGLQNQFKFPTYFLNTLNVRLLTRVKNNFNRRGMTKKDDGKVFLFIGVKSGKILGQARA